MLLIIMFRGEEAGVGYRREGEHTLTGEGIRD